MNFFSNKRKKVYLFLIAWIFFPVFSFALQVDFNEVMFDPDGVDTGREWVEIINNHNYAINLEKWKFCDSGSCHYLYDGFGNDFVLESNKFGILTKDPNKFKSDYPEFNGFILKSSFSLNNNNEKLELKNKEGNLVAMVEYNSEIGGKKGDTFSLFGDIWKNGKASPNSENIEKDINDQTNNSSSSTSTTPISRTYAEISDSDIIDEKKKIRAEIVDDIPDLIAGAENEFHARAYGLTGIEIYSLEYFWNFGDGEKSKKRNPKHTYLSSGEYVISLTIKSANFSGSTRRIVKVVNPNLEISEVSTDKNWLKIKNNYSELLKLDNWTISTNDYSYTFPKETYILANQELILHNKITNLDIDKNVKLDLKFPNGKIFTSYNWNKRGSIKIKKIPIKNVQSASMINSVVVNVKKYIRKDTDKKKEIIKEEDNVNELKIESSTEKVTENNNFQRLEIKKEQNFILDHIYFIYFLILNFGLIIISIFIKRKRKVSDISNLAKEFEIEEV